MAMVSTPVSRCSARAAAVAVLACATAASMAALALAFSTSRATAAPRPSSIAAAPSHSAPGGGAGLGASAQNNVHGKLDDRPGQVEVVQHRVLAQPQHELLARASVGDACPTARL